MQCFLILLVFATILVFEVSSQSIPTIPPFVKDILEKIEDRLPDNKPIKELGKK